MSDILACAWRELKRRRSRATVTVLGYALAVGTLVTLVSLLLFARDAASAVLATTGTHFISYMPSCETPCYLHDAAGKVVPSTEAFIANGGVLTTTLNQITVDGTAKLAPVRDAAAYILFRFTDKKTNQPYTAAGLDMRKPRLFASLTATPDSLVAGRFLTPQAPRQALVEKAYAEPRALKVGKRVNIGGDTFTVVGIVDTGMRAAKADYYTRIEDLRPIVNRRIPLKLLDVSNLMLVEAKSLALLPQAIADIKRAMPATINATSSCSKPAASVMGMNERAVWLLTALIGLFALVLSGNAQLASVVERRRDIGILKAIGWTDRAITLQILAESVILAGIGGGLGCLGAICVLLLTPIKLISGIQTPLPITVSPLVLLAGLALALLAGVLAGALPAHRAARQHPAEALRQV